MASDAASDAEEFRVGVSSFGDGAEVTDHAVAAVADAALDAETRAARNRLAVERVADDAALAALAAATDFDADVSFRAATETKTATAARAGGVGAASRFRRRVSERLGDRRGGRGSSSRRGTAPSPTRAPPSNDTPRRSRVVSRRRTSRRIGARDRAEGSFARRRTSRTASASNGTRGASSPRRNRRWRMRGDAIGRTRHVGGVRRRAGGGGPIGSRRNSSASRRRGRREENAEAAARLVAEWRPRERSREDETERERDEDQDEDEDEDGAARAVLLEIRTGAFGGDSRDGSCFSPASVSSFAAAECPGGFAALRAGNPTPGGVVVFRRGGIFRNARGRRRISRRRFGGRRGRKPGPRRGRGRGRGRRFGCRRSRHRRAHARGGCGGGGGGGGGAAGMCLSGFAGDGFRVALTLAAAAADLPHAISSRACISALDPDACFPGTARPPSPPRTRARFGAGGGGGGEPSGGTRRRRRRGGEFDPPPTHRDASRRARVHRTRRARHERRFVAPFLEPEIFARVGHRAATRCVGIRVSPRDARARRRRHERRGGLFDDAVEEGDAVVGGKTEEVAATLAREANDAADTFARNVAEPILRDALERALRASADAHVSSPPSSEIFAATRAAAAASLARSRSIAASAAVSSAERRRVASLAAAVARVEWTLEDRLERGSGGAWPGAGEEPRRLRALVLDAISSAAADVVASNAAVARWEHRAAATEAELGETSRAGDARVSSRRRRLVLVDAANRAAELARLCEAVETFERCREPERDAAAEAALLPEGFLDFSLDEDDDVGRGRDADADGWDRAYEATLERLVAAAEASAEGALRRRRRRRRRARAPPRRHDSRATRPRRRRKRTRRATPPSPRFARRAPTVSPPLFPARRIPRMRFPARRRPTSSRRSRRFSPTSTRPSRVDPSRGRCSRRGRRRRRRGPRRRRSVESTRARLAETLDATRKTRRRRRRASRPRRRGDVDDGGADRRGGGRRGGGVGGVGERRGRVGGGGGCDGDAGRDGNGGEGGDGAPPPRSKRKPGSDSSPMAEKMAASAMAEKMAASAMAEKMVASPMTSPTTKTRRRSRRARAM